MKKKFTIYFSTSEETSGLPTFIEWNILTILIMGKRKSAHASGAFTRHARVKVVSSYLHCHRCFWYTRSFSPPVQWALIKECSFERVLFFDDVECRYRMWRNGENKSSRSSLLLSTVLRYFVTDYLETSGIFFFVCRQFVQFSYAVDTRHVEVKLIECFLWTGLTHLIDDGFETMDEEIPAAISIHCIDTDHVLLSSTTGGQ